MLLAGFYEDCKGIYSDIIEILVSFQYDCSRIGLGSQLGLFPSWPPFFSGGCAAGSSGRARSALPGSRVGGGLPEEGADRFKRASQDLIIS